MRSIPDQRWVGYDPGLSGSPLADPRGSRVQAFLRVIRLMVRLSWLFHPPQKKQKPQSQVLHLTEPHQRLISVPPQRAQQGLQALRAICRYGYRARLWPKPWHLSGLATDRAIPVRWRSRMFGCGPEAQRSLTVFLSLHCHSGWHRIKEGKARHPTENVSSSSHIVSRLQEFGLAGSRAASRGSHTPAIEQPGIAIVQTCLTESNSSMGCQRNSRQS